MIGIAWHLLLDEVSRPSIHLCRLVEGGVRKEDDVEEASGELENATTKEEELSHGVVPIPRPPPPFP